MTEVKIRRSDVTHCDVRAREAVPLVLDLGMSAEHFDRPGRKNQPVPARMGLERAPLPSPAGSQQLAVDVQGAVFTQVAPGQPAQFALPKPGGYSHMSGAAHG